MSFHDFEKMQSDKHRIENVLLNYDIIDPYEVKLVKKFIKYIINIPNAKSKKNKELSEIIQSKKFKKTSFKDLPDDIVKTIGKKYYDIMKEHKLLDWINENDLSVEMLSRNPHPGAIDILKKRKARKTFIRLIGMNYHTIQQQSNCWSKIKIKYIGGFLSWNKNPAAINRR